VNTPKLACFLGIQATHSQCDFAFHQQPDIKKMLESFGMRNCRPVEIPAESSFRLLFTWIDGAI